MLGETTTGPCEAPVRDKFSVLLSGPGCGIGEGVCVGVFGFTRGKLLVVPAEELNDATDGC